MTFTCAHAGLTTAANHPALGYIGPGIVFSDVQTSRFVRPTTATECNGFAFAENVLRNSDLAHLERHIPEHLTALILKATKTEAVIVYQFFHFRQAIRIAHGWIVTKATHQFIAQVVTGPTWKSADVIAQCRKAVCLLDITQEAA